MRLVDLLTESQVVCGLTASGKEDSISRLVDVLVSAGKLSGAHRASALKAVLDRERSLSTGMEQGIAIPHGSIDEIGEMVCALGVAPAGVEFESLDDLPAKLIILLVIPRQKFSQHVRTLAGIARLLNHARMRERLKQAETPAQVLQILREEEQEPQKP